MSRAGGRPEDVVVSVVVVNWNAAALTQACLDSLAAQETRFPFRTVVVDNGSTDGSADRLEPANADVTVVRRASNGGFGAGANAGIAAVASDVVVLLNNDAEADPGFVEAIVTALLDDPGAAAVTGRILLAGRWRRVTDRTGIPGILVDAYGAQWERTAAGGTVLTNSTGNIVDATGNGMDRDWLAPHPVAAPEDVFGFSGGAVALRSTALRSVGTFDESLFMYYEDTELSWRLRRGGWTVAYAPDAIVHHAHAASSGTDSALFVSNNTANRLIVCVLHGSLRMQWAAIARTIARVIALAPRALRDRSARDRLGYVAAGLARFTRRYPALVRRRAELNRAASVDRSAVLERYVAR